MYLIKSAIELQAAIIVFRYGEQQKKLLHF